MAELAFSKIRRAAVEQQWCVERTSRNHWRLVPPQKSMPIVVTSGTTGDQRAIYNFLSQMRRSGLVWPPPPKERKPQVSSFGFASVDVMLNGAGQSTVRGSAVRMAASISAEPLLCSTRLDSTDDRKDVAVTATVSEEVCSQELNGHSLMDSDRDTSEPDADGVRWATLWMPDRYGPIQRYRLSSTGVCVAEGSGTVLKRALNGQQFYVSMTNSVTKKSTSTRLDKLMLWTFVGEPKSNELEFPIHRNGETSDCSIENLRWKLETEVAGDYPPQRPYGEAPKRVEAAEPKVKAKKNGFTPVDEDLMLPDDDVSVALVFSSCGVTMKYEDHGGWSISPCHELSDDQIKAVGRMIQRWQGVTHE